VIEARSVVVSLPVIVLTVGKPRFVSTVMRRCPSGAFAPWRSERQTPRTMASKKKDKP
jgi:hypothetical protein